LQRGNAEMQRRAQEVDRPLLQLGEANPILSIHDVGAGGLSNAVPEIVHAAERGARVQLREHSHRGQRHVAAGDLVQRGAGAIRFCD